MPILISRPWAGIALVTISNPGCRNALGPDDFQGLASTWNQLALDDSLRCVVITGDGQTAFCAGARLGADFHAVPDIDDLVDRALLKTRVFPRPIVAAVNGHCVAGGFELMLASDIRVASADAKFGLPEVRWGIVPSGGAAMKLVEQIGHARAMRLLLTAELIGADEAHSFGIVNEVVAAGDVLARALHFARLIASNSPLAVFHTKQLALGGRADGWREREPAERRSAALVRRSGDAFVGKRAFFAKVDPDYSQTGEDL